MSRIRVLLVDDVPDYLERLLRHFESDAGFEVVGKAQDGREALAQAEDKDPHVIVLDMALPGDLDGVQVVRRLRSQGSSARILAISNHLLDHYIYGVLDEGASGYLIKDESLDTIAEGARGVFHGDECWFSPRVRARLSLRQVRALSPKPVGAIPKLTPKEEQALVLLAKGFANWKISRMMDIAENTVKNYLYTIYQKLGVGSRGEAQAWAHQYGYSKPSELQAQSSSMAVGQFESASLESELARLASILEARGIQYLLAGDVAVPRSAGSMIGEGVALVLSHAFLKDIPELGFDGQNRDWTRAALGLFRIDLLLVGESVLSMLIADHSAQLSLAGNNIRCVSPLGQILLKLSLLPGLYREAHFSKVVQWESDIATLIFEHRPEIEPLLMKLSSYLSDTDQSLVSQLLEQIYRKVALFRSSES